MIFKIVTMYHGIVISSREINVVLSLGEMSVSIQHDLTNICKDKDIFNILTWIS